MKVLTRLLLLSVALLAAYMARRALRRQPETIITLLWALIGLTAAASTPGTAKARTVESRLNAVVAAVGTVNGTAVTASNAANTAQGTANNAQTLANNAQTLANNAQGDANTALAAANNANTNAGNRVAKTGDTMSGNLTVSGQMHSSTVVVDSVLTVSGQRIAPGQNRPAFYPQGGAPANSVIATDLNQIVGTLIAAGICN